MYANAYLLRAFTGDRVPFGRAIDYGAYRLARWFGTQATGGSTAVRGTGHYGMRIAGAAARRCWLRRRRSGSACRRRRAPLPARG